MIQLIAVPILIRHQNVVVQLAKAGSLRRKGVEIIEHELAVGRLPRFYTAVTAAKCLQQPAAIQRVLSVTGFQ